MSKKQEKRSLWVDFLNPNFPLLYVQNQGTIKKKNTTTWPSREKIDNQNENPMEIVECTGLRFETFLIKR